MGQLDRRTFIALLAASMVTPFASVSRPSHARMNPDNVRIDGLLSPSPAGSDSETGRIFPSSVASGDPSPTGVILWTRIAPSAVRAHTPLYFQVAYDADFTQPAYEGVVDGRELRASHDFTVKIDLDGLLQANQRYYYRFLYAGTASRVGRCRTAPALGAHVEALKFAVLTCQDYRNGYYSALQHLAGDDGIDFVIHLGDFIYEDADTPNTNQARFVDRSIVLPSAAPQAMDLEDYRHLYRRYRDDRHLQRAMENHTWVMVFDDHEITNDCYWDYVRDTLGAPSHPYTTDAAFNNDPELLNQLMLDAQRAWLEYTPARVQVNESSTHPQHFLTIYRHLVFGDLLDLFMLDSRTYRTPHPCGEAQHERFFPLTCNTITKPEQSMLGTTQRDWLLSELPQSTQRWKVLGNQTYMGCFGLRHHNKKIPFNLDAWDGYQAERALLVQSIQAHEIDNLVVLTGDLHIGVASHVLGDHSQRADDPNNIIGVEFITPPTTSASWLESLLRKNPSHRDFLSQLFSFTARITNPHLQYVNGLYQGYSTIVFRHDWCEWACIAVDKNTRTDAPHARTLITRRKYPSVPWLLNQP